VKRGSVRQICLACEYAFVEISRGRSEMPNPGNPVTSLNEPSTTISNAVKVRNSKHANR
jgi:hypothetical protein